MLTRVWRFKSSWCSTLLVYIEGGERPGWGAGGSSIELIRRHQHRAVSALPTVGDTSTLCHTSERAGEQSSSPRRRSAVSARWKQSKPAPAVWSYSHSHSDCRWGRCYCFSWCCCLCRLTAESARSSTPTPVPTQQIIHPFHFTYIQEFPRVFNLKALAEESRVQGSFLSSRLRVYVTSCLRLNSHPQNSACTYRHTSSHFFYHKHKCTHHCHECIDAHALTHNFFITHTNAHTIVTDA